MAEAVENGSKQEVQILPDRRILELSLDAHYAPRLVDQKKLHRRYIRRNQWME